MEMKDRIQAEIRMRSGLMENPQKYSPDRQYFSFSNQHHDQVERNMDYEMRIQDYASEFIPNFDSNDQTQVLIDAQSNPVLQDSGNLNWDPNSVLKNLSFLEVKIHQLQDMVHLIVGRKYDIGDGTDEVTAQQQQLISGDLASIIAQLISAAGSLLPSASQNNLTTSSDQPNGVLCQLQNGLDFSKLSKQAEVAVKNHITEQNNMVEEHEMKDEEDVEEGEHLPPGSYEILQLEKEEILAPHTHFCTICGKGFKRDANLRMHMRGHGDEYKSPAALAKPNKECNLEPVLIKRYSCPYSGCKRNKDHKKFQPLKTMLCVKNHYKRTHCDKSYICSRCNNKKFSVIADLKTHEKHCGRDKWLCSCGTTFSRKDKLFGHITLFQGHTPADEKNITVPDPSQSNNVTPNKVQGIEFNFNSDTPINCRTINQDMMDYKANLDDTGACFSPLTFDPCNLIGFEEFPRTTFEDSDSSFSFSFPGSFGYDQKNEGDDHFK